MPIPTILLGRTQLSISRVAMGAGPVSGLMTGSDRQLQLETLRRVVDVGINWIDTAAGYGNGASESNLRCGASELNDPRADALHIATKVRIDIESTESILSQVERGLADSLARLKRGRVTLLQLHNGLTERRGDEPASLSPADVLGSNGVVEAMQSVANQGLTQFIGLTGTGHASAMRAVIRSGAFDTIQLPYNMLNPSAGQTMPLGFVDRNYGNILVDCAEQQMGAMAIRVMAAGALLGAPPSAHTLKTPYFPLALYQADLEQAAALRQNASESMPDRALQFALAHPAIHAAIIVLVAPNMYRTRCVFEPDWRVQASFNQLDCQLYFQANSFFISHHQPVCLCAEYCLVSLSQQRLSGVVGIYRHSSWLRTPTPP